MMDNNTHPVTIKQLELSNPERLDDLAFEIRWHLEYLLSVKKLVAKNIVAEVWDILASAKTKNQIDACIQYLDKVTKQRPVWNELREELSKCPSDEERESTQGTLREMIKMNRVTVDTSGDVLMHPTRMDASNRMLRLWRPYTDRFLRVDFKREVKEDRIKYSKFRKERAIYNGIYVSGRLYTFLLSSDAGLKWSKCWYFAETDQVTTQIIRKSLGDFSHLTSPFKYCARLGLSLSVSIPTFEIEDSQVEIVPDILNEKYCFSDGCGQVSQEYAAKIAQVLGLDYVPCSFQIRYRGVKGVITVFPLPVGVHLRLRRSMYKFYSEHRILEVLDWAKPECGYLDRQKVMILGHLGIPDEVFLNFQREGIHHFLNSPKFPLESEFLLEGNTLVRELVTQKSPEKEAFLSRVLNKLSNSRLRLIEKKSVFPINNSRLALGVLDETGTLEYGQVFFQYSDINGGARGQKCSVLKHRVIVNKVPSLHPGDVRILECVDVPQLHHLVDVIVFPMKGPRPHPNEISGGDLDGDKFFICWEDKLIPESQVEPGDYGNFSYEEFDLTLQNKLTHKDEQKLFTEMQSIFIEYEYLDITGDIHNKWQAFADSKGLDSEECKSLIKAFQSAVKSTKHGLKSDIQYPNPLDFPHYMYVKPSRKSSHILGKLYDEAENICDSMFVPVTDPIELDNSILEQYGELLKFSTPVQELYGKYIEEVSNLVKSIDYHDFVDLYNEESYMPTIIKKYKLLLQKLQNKLGLTEKEMAGLCYIVAYQAAQEQEKAKKKIKSDVCIGLSFPWCVSRLLWK